MMSLLNMNLIPATQPSDPTSSLANSAPNFADNSDSFNAHLSRMQSTSSSVSPKENNSSNDASRPSPSTQSSNSSSQPKTAKPKAQNSRKSTAAKSKDSNSQATTTAKSTNQTSSKSTNAQSQKQNSSEDSGHTKDDDTQDATASLANDPLAAAMAAAANATPLTQANDSPLPVMPAKDVQISQPSAKINPAPSNPSTPTNNAPQPANNAPTDQASTEVDPADSTPEVETAEAAKTPATSQPLVDTSNVATTNTQGTSVIANISANKIAAANAAPKQEAATAGNQETSAQGDSTNSDIPTNKATATSVERKKETATTGNQDSSSLESSAAVNTAAMNAAVMNPAAMPPPELSAGRDTQSSDKKNDDESMTAVKGTPATSAHDLSGNLSANAMRSAAGTGDSSQAVDGSAQSTASADQVDRMRFVQRVANAFEAMGDRSGSVRVRLSPPELGSIRLEITYRNGTVSARVQTDTAAARDILVENLPALRDHLAQQRIKVERFDVDLSDPSLGGSNHQPGSGQQSMYGQAHSQSQPPYPTRSSSQQSAAPATGAIAPSSEEGRLNVLI